MTISKIEQLETEFILKLVGERFKSDRAFYNGIIPQRSWDRLKSGESSLWNMATKSYNGMLNKLFTPYEQYLLNLSRQHVQFNWPSTIEEAFNKLKLQHAQFMVNQGAQINVSSSFDSYPGDERINRGTALKIEDELGNYITFTINVPSHQVPSGRQNRKEWFEKEFKKVVVI